MLDIWLIIISFVGQMALHTCRTYILSEACRNPPIHDPLRLYPNTRHLRIDDLNDSLVLYSHEGVMSNRTGSLNATIAYPHGFSCEVVVHTPLQNAKMMLMIEKFFIPSVSKDCVDNYLYVFDSNNAKAKAMPEAGGERGLCQSTYPRFPIFTTSPFICIAFHTSVLPSMLPFGQHTPGFRLVLTAIRETSTSTCPSNSFYCGLRPTNSLGYSDTGSSLFVDRRSYLSDLGSHSIGRLRQSAVSIGFSSFLGYCIPEKTVCDGVWNCADHRDEQPESCNEHEINRLEHDGLPSGWLAGFLSLGVPASIAIAVSTIVIFTVCIGTVVCCCHRCCCKTPQLLHTRSLLSQPCQRRYSQTFSQTRVCSSRSFEKADFTEWSNGGDCGVIFRQLPAAHCALAVDDCSQSRAVSVSQQSVNLFPVDRIKWIGTQSRVCPSQNVPSDLPDSSAPFNPAKQSEKSYSAAFPPHVFSGFQTSLSSPDHLTLDSCSYTPPPYGVCVVPPASSASSRTGTTNGDGGRKPRIDVSQVNDNSKQTKCAVLSVQRVSENSGCANEPYAFSNESNGVLFCQQLSGSGHSALHTNTPVEATSQYGADLSLNGGIVYLGEMPHPFLSKDSPSCDGTGVVRRSGSNTTGSGSSYNRKRYSRRRAMYNAMQNIRYTSESTGHRRSKALAYQRQQYRNLPDSARTASSGSQTPASSRSGLPSSLRSVSDQMETNFHCSLPSSTSYPVQL